MGAKTGKKKKKKDAAKGGRPLEKDVLIAYSRE